MRHLIPFVLAIIAFVSTWAPAALADKRVALVIGNSAYQNAASLPNPVNDSEDIAMILKKVGFNVLLERNLDKRSMERAVTRFARMSQDADTALFFYAGHGLQYHGSNYLVPIDAKLEDEFNLNFELNRVDDVLFGLERAHGVKILILDACRNNPLADRLARTATTRDLIPTRGLAKIEATRGMVIAYSTQANQVAVDGLGRNSPFTSALVKEINEPGIEIGTLFRRVAASVNRMTDGRQLPELAVSLIGDFYLNTADTDLQAWAKLRTSSDLRQFKSFITDYPNSALIPDAREHLSAIEMAEKVRMEEAQRAQAERERVAEQAAREKLSDDAARVEVERQPLGNEGSKRTNSGTDAEPPALSSSVVTAPVQTAVLTPSAESLVNPPKPIDTMSGAGLVHAIKNELKRVGCYGGRIDDKWASADTRLAVRRYAKYSNLPTAPDEPAIEFLDSLHAKSGRVCPLECETQEVEKDGRCVGKACPTGLTLNVNGACEKHRSQRTAVTHRSNSRDLSASLESREVSGDAAARSLVGRTVDVGGDGRATYGKNGSYKYVTNTGRVSVGRYKIVGSQVCATFVNGRSRCDSIQRSGKATTLTNQYGRSFEMR